MTLNSESVKVENPESRPLPGLSAAAAPEVKIAVQGLVKNFITNGNVVEVLKGLDLEVYQGETLAVVGASGVGKSTLLHILGTLERPTTGQVLWDGEEVFALDDRRLAAFRNRKVGFVFQFHYLLPEFNALENVMMPALIARRPKAEARFEAENILTRVGLKDRLGHRVSTLSGGEQQRVAVARALVLKPEVLLADEPTGNLDPKSGAQVQELLLDLNRDYGLTSVIVTHNLELARASDRQITLVDGRAMTLRGD